jgi:hypothetical protein
MRESRIESALVRGAKRHGAEVRKLAWPGRRHAPDRVVFWGAGRFDFVELKAPGKTARDGQVREHKRLRALGFNVFVLDTLYKVALYLIASSPR